jgi:5'-3' exonuclease
MGVPVYFKTILKQHREILRETLNGEIDCLCFDLNCLIHPCCRGYGPKEEERMIQTILDMIHTLCNKVNPRYVYLAVDGPAPKPKLIQQKIRRFQSANEIKEWDTNAITPGTRFMDTLMNILHKECKSTWILSDSNEPGEGEHKIFSYLRKTNFNDIVVYGLDADLIMLSLLSCSQKKIFLLRERTEYNIENIDSEYIYLDVNRLSDYIVKDMKPSEYYLTNKHLLYDYLFLCFFLGNDFVQKTPSINIRYHGLDQLLNLYHTIQREQQGTFSFVNEENQLTYSSLYIWFQRLSKTERDRMHHIQMIRDKQELYWKKKVGVDDIDNHYPILNRNVEKYILKKDNWDTYYTLYMMFQTVHMNPSYDDILLIKLDDICRSYIESLQWTFHYYLNYSPMYWRWFNSYTFAPSMRHVFQWLCKHKNLPSIHIENDSPFSSEEQLAYVLPDCSLSLCLSKENVMQYRENYEHPNRASYCYLFKRYKWEGIPLLPF